MRRYDLHERALGDILALSDYVEGFREQAGDALVDDVFDCLDHLAEFPHMGRERPELGDGLRSFALNRRRLTIFYYAQPDSRDRVLIVRVFRQERSVSEEDFQT